ncbi:hypothetical protein Tco_1355876 [Tanacetum coccineum]
MGEYWVMIEFQTEASKEKFMANVGIDDEEESDTDDELRDEELHDESTSMHNYVTIEGESNVKEVSETIFENEQYQAHKKDDLNVG